MEKTVAINHEEEMDYTVTIERSPDFFLTSQQLSDFVKDLPLDNESNDQLVALMVAQVKVAEHDALLQGFRMGIQFALGKQRTQATKPGTNPVQ